MEKLMSFKSKIGLCGSKQSQPFVLLQEWKLGENCRVEFTEGEWEKGGKAGKARLGLAGKRQRVQRAFVGSAWRWICTWVSPPPKLGFFYNCGHRWVWNPRDALRPLWPEGRDPIPRHFLLFDEVLGWSRNCIFFSWTLPLTTSIIQYYPKADFIILKLNI